MTRMFELRWTHNNGDIKVYVVKGKKIMVYVKSPKFVSSAVPQSLPVYIDSLLEKFPADEDKITLIEWGDGYNNFLGASRVHTWEVVNIIMNEWFKKKEKK